MKKKDITFSAIVAVLTIVILFTPSLTNKKAKANAVRGRGRIVSVDNSEIKQFGVIKTGDQGLTVEMLSTEFRGEVFQSTNLLIGKMKLDKIFEPGDTALVVLDIDPMGKPVYANVIDHYRVHWELILFGIFVLILIMYANWTGLKAIISFAFSAAVIWKLLIPGFLLNLNPIALSLALVTILTLVIVFLVGGITTKSVVAFSGSILGIVLTGILSIIFGKLFMIHGAVKPFSETLLYSGYPNLDLREIFFAGIFIASSGAVMDIAMDIAASMEEVLKKHPTISARELTFSGFRVGRAVVGTMTTTLFLAYSGGYMSLLMIFIAQGTPLMNVLNLTYVSAEILHTLVGSIGLVTVAPFTAIVGGFIYRKKQKSIEDRALSLASEEIETELSLPVSTLD